VGLGNGNGVADVAQTPAHQSTCLAINEIVAPLDSSAVAECTLPFVSALASAFSAHITLLHVLEPATDPAPAPDALEWEMARAEAHARLMHLQSTFQTRGLTTEVEIVQGKAAEQITHFAKTRDADLIVLASHGVGGINDWNLGGTVHKVIATTHASVLIVPAHRQFPDPVRFHRMLLPLDCSQRAECVLPAATELARAHDAELILAHVVPEPEMPRRMPPSSEDLDLAERIVDRNSNEATRYLHDIQRRLSAHGSRVEVRVVVSSRRTQSLRELARQEQVDLVIFSAHGSTGDAKQRYGGVASRFLQEGGEPVIILQDLAEVLHAPGIREATGQERPGH